MANLFLDLCFDIVLVYHRILGNAPQEPEDTRWLESKMALLDAEFKSLSPESPMASKLSSTLNDRFVQRCIDSGTPVALLNYLDDQVLHYASFNSVRIPAISLTNNLLFVVVRLMDSIYEYQPEPLSHQPEEMILSLPYTNRAGKTYFLYQGVTRTGKPRYYFSGREKVGAEQITRIPEGYEIYERPENGQVFLRKVTPRLLTEVEQQCIASALAALKEPFRYLMDCQKQYVTIFESSARDTESEMREAGRFRNLKPDYMEKMVRMSHFIPVLRFELVDREKRKFHPQRFCFLGRIDDWISLKGSGDLSTLANQYIPLLGTDAFYEVSW